MRHTVGNLGETVQHRFELIPYHFPNEVEKFLFLTYYSKEDSLCTVEYVKKYILLVAHCLGMSYYVNFLRGLGSNEFHIK